MMKLAIFDFDGTIYENETFSLLMNHLKEHPVYGNHYAKFYRSALLPYIGYKIKLYPEEKMKKRLMQNYLQVLDGLSKKEITLFFTEIAGEMKTDLNKHVLSRMKEHKDNGFHIMIVSGAFTPLLESIAKDFPVDTIIGTDIPIQNGLYDANKEITHVHAERKTDVVYEYVDPKTVNWGECYAYGDSFSDLSILSLVGNPVAVRPDERLLTVAKQKGWEIIE